MMFVNSLEFSMLT